MGVKLYELIGMEPLGSLFSQLNSNRNEFRHQLESAMMLTARNLFIVKYQRSYGTNNRRSSCDLT